jgi:tRNA (adenine37-N6)-methyltransferase
MCEFSNNDKQKWLIQPIGHIYSPYKQKFGLARQPGLVPAAHARIDLCSQFKADCVRGLEEYDYIWVQFIFHAAIKDGWLPLIRPPKLGGKEKKGVFATRSPHRPNHLGLSLLKLEQISITDKVSIYVSGIDLLDQTPVIDIKPYLPFVEAKANAAGSYAQPRTLLEVQWSEEAQQQMKRFGIKSKFYQLVNQSLSQDPRPAHQQHSNKTYVMNLGDWDILFLVNGIVVVVTQLRKHVEI